MHIYHNCYKNFFTFFLKNIRMNSKKHKFWQQKNKKKSLLQKQKIFNIDYIYVNKILVSEILYWI